MQVAAIAELLLLLHLLFRLLLQRLSAFAGSYFSNVFPRLTTQFSHFLISNCGAHVVAKGRGQQSCWGRGGGVTLFAFGKRFLVRNVSASCSCLSLCRRRCRLKRNFPFCFHVIYYRLHQGCQFMPLACPRDSQGGRAKGRGIRFIQSLDISGALSFLVRRSLLARCLLGPLCVSISRCPRLTVVAVVVCVIA